MPENFNGGGYKDIREHIKNEWTHVSLIDESGAEVTRINISSDSRITWTNSFETNPLEITVEITGSDSDIPLSQSGSVTISEIELYKSSSATVSMSIGTFPDATLESTGDELTITQQIEVPPQ